MANVRLTEDFGGHKAGEVVNLPASVARSLIHKKKALDGDAVLRSWKPSKEKAKKSDGKAKKPTSDNTVDEIKAYLDAEAIEYDTKYKKAELLDLV